MTDTDLVADIQQEQQQVAESASKFDRSGGLRSMLHTVLILTALILPLVTAVVGSTAGWWALLVGALSAIVVYVTQNYNLRAHAEIKWETAGRLRELAGELRRLARDAQREVDSRPDDIEDRLSTLRTDRENTLREDRTRISEITPRRLEESALESVGVTPTGGPRPKQIEGSEPA